jgi:hypothetical protein
MCTRKRTFLQQQSGRNFSLWSTHLLCLTMPNFIEKYDYSFLIQYFFANNSTLEQNSVEYELDQCISLSLPLSFSLSLSLTHTHTHAQPSLQHTRSQHKWSSLLTNVKINWLKKDFVYKDVETEW